MYRFRGKHILDGGEFFGDLFDYYSDITPGTEEQYNDQRFLAGIVPWYGGWMRSRAEDKRSADNRKALGIGWSDVVNPWVASLSGGNTSQAYGSSFESVSKNFYKLYR